MKKTILTIAGCALAGTVICGVLYIKLHIGLLLTLAITAGTTAYHIWMRLVIGGLFHRFFQHADVKKKWYQLHPWEQSLYQKLRIKKWKGQMPTWRPGDFDVRKHTPEEIVQTMCQSEVGHETIFLFSFFPLAATYWFGSFWVFFITSVVTAFFCDLPFIMMQRYNRARVIKMIDRKRLPRR